MKSDPDGHRQRLRKKFISNGFAGFLDYEIVELLLTLGLPRKDCKPIAKELLHKYKSVSGVIYANKNETLKFKGLGESSIFGIKLARELGVYLDVEKLNRRKNVVLNIEQIAKLLMKEIGHSKKEVFKVVCLNIKGTVISDTVSIGALDMSVAHPREVFKIAIDNNASSILISHNHPSGDTSPSDDDIYTTRRLVESGKILGINVVDHIIVSTTKFTRLSDLKYI